MAQRVCRSSKFASLCLALVGVLTLSCADNADPSAASREPVPSVADPNVTDPNVIDPSAVDPLDVPPTPPQSALAIFGGQTGSEATDDEAAGPCDETGSEVEPDAGAAVGVSASDVLELIAGEWQLQVNEEQAQRLLLELSEPQGVRALEQQRGEQCVPLLVFSVLASLELADAGSLKVELGVRAEAREVFAVFVEFETREALGAQALDNEVLQLLIAQADGRSVGWLQAAEAEHLEKRRTLAVMLRQ